MARKRKTSNGISVSGALRIIVIVVIGVFFIVNFMHLSLSTNLTENSFATKSNSNTQKVLNINNKNNEIRSTGDNNMKSKLDTKVSTVSKPFREPKATPKKPEVKTVVAAKPKQKDQTKEELQSKPKSKPNPKSKHNIKERIESREKPKSKLKLKKNEDEGKHEGSESQIEKEQMLEHQSEKQNDDEKPTNKYQSGSSKVGFDSTNIWRTTDVASVLKSISGRSLCQHKPVFTTMAKVDDDPLYWELIENFFHTMERYEHEKCAILICITDPVCIQKCQKEGFSCVDFDYYEATGRTSPSANAADDDKHVVHIYEQISLLKLDGVAKILASGVNIMLLDLDVGFLRDPMLLVNGFFENPEEQVRTQMDVGYSQDKNGKWWFTHPRPNFGLFLVKPHPWSIKIFQRAWRLYQGSEVDKRRRVATDQNYLANAIKWARWRADFNFSYFDVGFELDTKPRPVLEQKALLLDKVKERSKYGIAFELGGRVAERELEGAIAVHSTCYEGSSKLLALRAANAYHNPKHFDSERRTLVKPLMSMTPESLYKEIASLAFLSIKTNRSLIIPNIILGSGDSKFVKGQATEEACGGDIGGRPKDKKQKKALVFDKNSMESKMKHFQSLKLDIDRTFFCRELTRRMHFHSYRMLRNPPNHTVFHNGDWYWPGFRVVRNDHKVFQVLEPNYYGRCRDMVEYRKKLGLKVVDVPKPHILHIDVGHRQGHPGMEMGTHDILNELTAPDVHKQSRVVIHLSDSRFAQSGFPGGEEALKKWAEERESFWSLDALDGDVGPGWNLKGNGVVDKTLYVNMPALSTLMSKLSLDLEDVGELQPQSDLAHSIFREVKICRNFNRQVAGNRTCFATCKM